MTHHPREPSLRASHTSAIAFRGVRKRFEGRAVLSDLSLEVRAGEIFAIVGTNGAGKTTCIRCLLDLCHVDDGRIDIFGRPASAPESRRPLAYLPERFLPPRDLLGREFLDFMARMHGVEPSSDRRQAVSSALDLAPSALDRPVREYSKGMARKLGLAGCFLSGKSLFVLDEPMSGLDPKARLLARRCLAERRAGGATVFFSTHLLGDAGDMCDRLAVVHDGAVRFAGSPARFRERYPAPTLEESWLACISSEAVPQTDKACSAPLPDASLQGTSYPSQPRTSTRETTFGNLAHRPRGLRAAPLVGLTPDPTGCGVTEHRPRGLRAAPLVEIDAAQGF